MPSLFPKIRFYIIVTVFKSVTSFCQCVDPCALSCGTGSECTVQNHVAICRCPRSTTGDPFRSCRKFTREEICAPCGQNTDCEVRGLWSHRQNIRHRGKGKCRPSCLECKCRPSCLEGKCRPSCLEGKCCPSCLEGKCRQSCLEGKCRSSCLEGQCRPNGLEGKCYLVLHIFPVIFFIFSYEHSRDEDCGAQCESREALTVKLVPNWYSGPRNTILSISSSVSLL